MKSFKNHWKLFTVLAVAAILLGYYLWPRPLSHFFPANPDKIYISTHSTEYSNPYTDRPGTYTYINKTYLFDTEKEVDWLLDQLASYTYHYPLRRLFEPVLSGIFYAEYRPTYHNNPDFPDSLSIWIHGEEFGESVLISPFGSKDLSVQDEGLLRIGYLGNNKGYQLYEDILKCLTDEYLDYTSSLQN